MQVSRRDMLKLAGLGAVGTVGLTLPLGGEASGSSISTLSSSRMPKPFTRSFQKQQTLEPYKKVRAVDGTWTHFYSVTAQRGTADLVAGLPTPILGYSGNPQGPGLAPPGTG